MSFASTFQKNVSDIFTGHSCLCGFSYGKWENRMKSEGAVATVLGSNPSSTLHLLSKPGKVMYLCGHWFHHLHNGKNSNNSALFKELLGQLKDLIYIKHLE